MSSSSAAMDLDAAESPLQGQVKYSFVHMRLAADWLEYYRLEIDVNFSLQISVNGGDWHGSAAYFIDGEGRDCWNLAFNWKADTSKMKTTLYRQIRDTCTYLSIESNSSDQYNCMLILKNA